LTPRFYWHSLRTAHLFYVFLLFSVWNSVNVLIFYTETPAERKYFFDKITDRTGSTDVSGRDVYDNRQARSLLWGMERLPMLNSTATDTAHRTAYLLVLHGSHDPRYESAIAHLTTQLNPHFGPPKPYRIAYLECHPTTLAEQIIDFAATVAAQGFDQIQLVPLFLLPGVHVMQDLPAAVDAARAALTTAGNAMTIVVQHYLGHPDADQAQWLARLAAMFPFDETQGVRVLVAHGTKRPGGNQPIEDIGLALLVRPAYWFVAPSLADEIAELMELGIRDVAILPYVLVEGSLTAGIDQQLAELAQQYPHLRWQRLPSLDQSGVLLAEILARCADNSVIAPKSAITDRRSGTIGTVYLVGAGPGDPGLLTLKAKALLEQANVVIYDALVSNEVLAMIHPDATLIHAGKRKGQHSLLQAETNQLLIDWAGRVAHVVRLKGGDPFMFGRGGEEMADLVAAGVTVEVVPGVTSGIAAPAYAGIPLTHRDYSSSVTFVTGHEAAGKYRPAIDWHRIALGAETIVIYMGIHNLETIVTEFATAGLAADTPIALVRWGTRPEQEELIATLGTVVKVVADRQFQAPAIAIVGAVVNFPEHLKAIATGGFD
jgi:uroporphyrin-III C-methyltransferase